jgi:hypothetical protein
MAFLLLSWPVATHAGTLPFFSGFEGEEPAAGWDRLEITGTNELASSTAQARVGTRSLKVIYAGDPTQDDARVILDPVPAPEALELSMHLWVPAVLDSAMQVGDFFRIVSLRDHSLPTHVTFAMVWLRKDSGGLYLELGIKDPAGVTFQVGDSSATPISSSTWQSLTLEYRKGEVARLYVAGVLAAEVKGADVGTYTVSSCSVGLTSHGNVLASGYWYLDEVTIAVPSDEPAEDGGISSPDAGVPGGEQSGQEQSDDIRTLDLTVACGCGTGGGAGAIAWFLVLWRRTRPR